MTDIEEGGTRFNSLNSIVRPPGLPGPDQLKPPSSRNSNDEHDGATTLRHEFSTANISPSDKDESNVENRKAR
ncbi:hypothetical protein SERLA73DRAFT_125471 [Serpula lacrymans var. lacrymans S7.3]|uniref:Uncharacterized protein n=1 Tax=Serpula lacrymans var. lacrymans (strain S7.3) TaxID=936435 RepID=F8Q991_SERL3|nr:hypothetical protein SERLA73DRAFT_125471 [Serpula lacrymans var. lacrymans S7.3]